MEDVCKVLGSERRWTGRRGLGRTKRGAVRPQRGAGGEAAGGMRFLTKGHGGNGRTRLRLSPEKTWLSQDFFSGDVYEFTLHIHDCHTVSETS